MLMDKEVVFFLRNGYLPSPRYIQIEITDACTLHCPQCYKKPSSRHIDDNLFYAIVDEAKAIGVNTVSLNGGEVFMHPSIDAFLDCLLVHNFSIVIFTSGSFLSEERMITIKQNPNIVLQVSLNGSTELVNGNSRDGFAITTATMKKLLDLDVSYGINWVSRHDNVNDLQSLIEFAKRFGASGVNVVCNKMNGSGFVDSPLDKQDYRLLAETIMLSDGYAVIQNCYGHLMPLLTGFPANKLVGCQAGISACCISVNGEYMPCTHLYHSSNNNGILDYWTHSNTLKVLRKSHSSLIEHCNSCGSNRICRVCRALSQEMHDDFSKGYSDCPLYEEVHYGS